MIAIIEVLLTIVSLAIAGALLAMAFI